MSASEDINKGETIAIITRKLLLSVDFVKSSEVKPIIEANPELFQDESLCLLLYLLREYVKEEESFWMPYLEAISYSDLPAFWSIGEIEECQDLTLIYEIKGYQKDMKKTFQKLNTILESHTKMFPPQKINEELFIKIYSLIVCRFFTSNLHSPMLILYLDFLNHKESEINYEVLHKTKSIKPQRSPSKLLPEEEEVKLFLQTLKPLRNSWMNSQLIFGICIFFLFNSGRNFESSSDEDDGSSENDDEESEYEEDEGEEEENKQQQKENKTRKEQEQKKNDQFPWWSINDDDIYIRFFLEKGRLEIIS